MMGLELTAALLISAVPTTVVTIPDVSKNLPKLKTSMSWAAKAKPSISPKRFNKFNQLLGLDFFDVSDWSKLGISRQHSAYLWSLPEASSHVVELRLENPKAFDASIKNALKTFPQAQKITDKTGLWYSPKPGQIMAAVRLGSRVLFQMDRQAGSLSGKGPVEILNSLLNGRSPPSPQKLGPMTLRDERLKPLRVVMNLSKPRLTRAQSKTKSTMWVHRLDKNKVYFSGPINLRKDGLDITISIKDRNFVNSDSTLKSIKPKFRSRRLFETSAIAGVGGELQVHLTPDAMRQWASENGITDDVSKVWSGEFHIVLMQSGALLAGVPVQKDATKSMVSKLEQSLLTFDPSMKQLVEKGYRGQQVWMFWWGDVSEKSMKKLLLKNKPTYSDGLVLSVRPPALLTGLKQRSLARDQMRIPGAQLLLMELAFGGLMKASRTMRSEIMVSPNQTEISVNLVY